MKLENKDLISFEIKKKYMARCLQLAQNGSGFVAPNPRVGCVIAHPEEGIIGEGWHAYFGGPHAEVVAMRSVHRPELLPESTAFVSLEPCSHYGKTPPCADLLINSGIGHVEIATLDPNPLVSGQGKKKLEQAGITVSVGLLEHEAKVLNASFLLPFKQKRPFVTLKWAQTADGFLAKENGESKWISSAESRQWVHRYRSEHQGILVGRGTLRQDNPSLTVRQWPGNQPIRMVVDPQLTLPEHLQIFSNSEARTWIFNSKVDRENGHKNWIRTEQPIEKPEILASELFSRGIFSLFVEGGAVVLQQWLESGLWDQLLIFRSATRFGSGIAAPSIPHGLEKWISISGGDLLQIVRQSSS